MKIIFFSFFALLSLFGGILFSSVAFANDEPGDPDYSINEDLVAPNIADGQNAQTGNNAVNISGIKDPVDVNYYKTPRTADLNNFGDFTPVRSLGSLVEKILSLLLGLVGVIGVLGIIVGGFMIMASAGDETMLDRGKTVILYSCIGIAVTLLALGLTTLVQTIFYSVDA